MKRFILALGAASTLSLGACAMDNGYGGGPGYYSEAPAGNYDAYQHYRQDGRYGQRPLSRNDRIYRGSDGRYYCRHSDGTTGLIVGGLAGGVLGNLIAPGGSATIGTLLGAAGGAVLGKELDQKNVKCE
ncbi:MAG: glycine zipper 2TM domain-containing protein [Sphingomonas sp.]